MRLVITAENSNGKSEAVVLDVFTSKVAQLQVGEQKIISGTYSIELFGVVES